MTRDEILKIDDLPVTDLYVTAWDKTVYLRALNGKQREEIEVRAHKSKMSGEAMGWKGLKALVLTFVLCDESGELLFTPQDADKLAKKSSKAQEQIFEEVMHVNGLTKEDAEDLAGN